MARQHRAGRRRHRAASSGARGAADQPIRISIPAFWRRTRALRRSRRLRPARVRHAARASSSSSESRTSIWPRPRLLDFYIARHYLAVFGLAFVSLLGIFYISTFIDLADKLFRGAATTRMLLPLLLFPDAAVRLLHHPDGGAGRDAGDDRHADQEQRADRHARLRHQPVSIGRRRCCCSPSLASGVLFELQEQRAGRRQPRSRRGSTGSSAAIRCRRSASSIAGGSSAPSGDIYHYEYFDPRQRTSSTGCRSSTSIPPRGSCESLTYADDAGSCLGAATASVPTWRRAAAGVASSRPQRSATSARTVVNYTPFAEPSARRSSRRRYFKTDEPDADRMTYGQLSDYIAQLQASGYHVGPLHGRSCSGRSRSPSSP